MPRGEHLSYGGGRGQEYDGEESQETAQIYNSTLEQMAAMDLAPPTDVQDVYTPNQLLARILRDGEEGYRQTREEHRAISEGMDQSASREDRKTEAYYQFAITMVDAIRKMTEAEGRAGNWRYNLNEHLVQALQLDDPPQDRPGQG